MGSGVPRNGDVEIDYEIFELGSGEPLLLVMGVGAQMLYWHDEFCQALAGQGFRVARFDNRDSGLSTRLTATGPSRRAMPTRPGQGRGVPTRLDLA
jgi:pimeloyl-ACP methyl ester carboxylesterase